ncbi:glycoside hydrolase family 78 protein, partial [Paenibacillus sp. FSL R7-269]|uniref:glycoside hydrolase family 78 protein n=1 Tax=Paenibacillus sp. FSL R7-269 TaxID=1226755 RepID=UPI001F3A1FA0
MTYPLGSQSAPSESNVSNPAFQWTQKDAARTNFAAYQVQVLDANGVVVVDSGEVKQPTTGDTNTWTVSTPLPAGQVFQVKVRVNDEHLWSEWSSGGWVKVK